MPVNWNYDPNFDDVDTVNMYGFTPCPRCQSRYRCSFNNAPGVAQCDDCGFDEPVVTKPVEDSE